MIANYHTHTWRCGHADGTEKEYVESAIEAGVKILGFSDHTPMPYPDGFVSHVKMRMDQLEGYVDTVLRLKEEYKDEIEIHLGLEVEYYPALFEKLREFAGQYPIEYFLLAMHYNGNEIGEAYNGSETEDIKQLRRYCAQAKEAIDTGCFTYFAHPDLIFFTGDNEIYLSEMRSLCEHAKVHDIPLEINMLGLGAHRNYPDPRFWNIVKEVGNRVVLGVDAHHVRDFKRPDVEKEARRMAAEYGLHLQDTVELVDPFI